MWLQFYSQSSLPSRREEGHNSCRISSLVVMAGRRSRIEKTLTLVLVLLAICILPIALSEEKETYEAEKLTTRRLRTGGLKIKLLYFNFFPLSSVVVG